MLIRENIPYTNHEINSELEAVSAKNYLGNYHHSNNCSIYIPPAESIEIQKIENLISQLGNQTLFLGDFNGHHPQWGSPSSDRRGDKITDIILNMDLAF